MPARRPSVAATFCTCSRRRSTWVLRSTTRCATTESLHFEPIVLASRKNSWAKVQLAADGAALRGRVELIEVAPEPRDLLGHVQAIGEQGDLPGEVGLGDRDVTGEIAHPLHENARGCLTRMSGTRSISPTRRTPRRR